MKTIKFTLIIFLFSLLNAKDDINLFDEYHDSLCKVLVNTSNSIDDYFIDDENSTLSSRTHAEFSTSFAEETYLGMEKDIRFRLRLNLPKIQKNLRLVFEDENSDNLLYDGTTLNDQNLEDKRYYLRLEAFSYLKDSLNIKLGGGVRFRDRNLVPYVNIRSNYELYNKEKNIAELFNRFRYYSDGEIENNLEFNSLLTLDDNLYVTWNNNFYHSNENEFEILFDDLSLIYLHNKKQKINFGIGVSSLIEKFQDFNVDYYYLHASFHHLFYKDWVYYELSPSILKRKINDFKTSYRFLVNFGIYFKSE
jgi:hypothetical protein